MTLDQLLSFLSLPLLSLLCFKLYEHRWRRIRLRLWLPARFALAQLCCRVLERKLQVEYYFSAENLAKDLSAVDIFRALI